MVSALPPTLAPDGPRPGSNLPEFSVSDLSRALKRTVEDAFGYVRVRGEISQPKRHSSGHLYLRLKDAEAVIEAVCWRGVAQRLPLVPEEGMEVTVTGRLTTYPGRSQYQLVIESMELAGAGALLKLLEERKRRLAAEGLFATERKQPLPFLPTVIGVITSPTGAVIRDILHRLADRFPRRVLLWPVAVQGEGAAAQVAAAVAGFNALPEAGRGRVPRPELLIVARGGGSLEDLMAFNEEVVVRAVAASAIPVISAVGHETDTTLIDYAADRRAPTPTAAAEMAVPVRAELLARVLENERRLLTGAARWLHERRTRLEGLSRGLGDPQRLIEGWMQRLDDRSERLHRSLRGLLERQRTRLTHYAARLPHPRQTLAEAERRLATEYRTLSGALRQTLRLCANRYRLAAPRLTPHTLHRQQEAGAHRLADLAPRLRQSGQRRLGEASARVRTQGQLLESYSFRRVLDRGFALVSNAQRQPVTSAAAATGQPRLTLTFHDGSVVVSSAPEPRVPRKSSSVPPPQQGSLF